MRKFRIIELYPHAFSDGSRFRVQHRSIWTLFLWTCTYYKAVGCNSRRAWSPDPKIPYTIKTFCTRWKLYGNMGEDAFLQSTIFYTHKEAEQCIEKLNKPPE